MEFIVYVEKSVESFFTEEIARQRPIEYFFIQIYIFKFT